MTRSADSTRPARGAGSSTETAGSPPGSPGPASTGTSAPAGTVWTVPVPAVDPRTWLPGTTSTASAAFTLPAGMPAGTYDVLVALPDAAETLRSDVRYSVRPANADNASRSQAWESSLGAFRTGTLLTVR